MKNDPNRPSLDGIALQRRTRSNDQLNKKDQFALPDVTKLRPHVDRTGALDERSDSVKSTEILPRPEVTNRSGLRRADIDASLQAVDEAPEQSKKRNKGKKIKKKWIALAVLLVLVGAVAYFGIKFTLAASRMVSGNLFDIFGSGTPLREDANGRTNILLFGTSEDDPGHQGADLTDSVIVMSLDQDKKDVALVSMPRDMWVDYDRACLAGYSGKINALYACASENGDTMKGAEALGDKVGEVFGLEVQYYTQVNYTVVRELTTALGGVTVNIKSDDPRGIYDYNTKLKLSNGPSTLHGEQALAFVRARGDGGGYGFEGSNFVREQNQQKMIIAMRDKALELGTLANPVAVDGMINALGNNIRTNFSVAETKTLLNLATDIKPENIIQISLVNDKKPVVTTGSYNGQSIVRPILGLTNYSGIQGYIKSQLSGGDVESEGATIEVLNGSQRAGVAAKQQTVLTQAGFMDVTTGNTAYSPSTNLVWFANVKNMPKTSEKLASVLGVKASSGELPAEVQSRADFVIIIGNDGTN